MIEQKLRQSSKEKRSEKNDHSLCSVGYSALGQHRRLSSSISDKQAQAWEQALKGESRADLPEWIFHGLTALGTANMVQCNGETYLVRQQCKPHDCGNNFIISAYQPSSQKAWGMIVEVKDVPEAIDTPSNYARYIFIGKPDKAIQFLLMEQLKEDPNWK